MSFANEDILREGRDSFFLYLKHLFWPEIDEMKLPSPDRQLELFRRLCVESGKEFWLKCSREQFNSLLTECGQRPVSSSFFEYFFPNFGEKIRLGDFIKGVRKFQRIALWKYGNFNLAFEGLRDSLNVRESLKGIPFNAIDPIPEDFFIRRRPFNFIQDDLTPEERCVLGHATDLSKVNKNVIARAESIKAVGKDNAHEYLVIDDLDVYVATSMREFEEYKSFKELLTDVFKHPDLAKLNLRYFDPTIIYCENRIAQGLLEALMLKRAKLTLYVAGKTDTFGKDSECAATLVQGKPVVVYVEETNDDKKGKMDRRARLFKDIHPLGLQVCHQTGVANGVIVVRNSQDCRHIIRGLLLHTLEVKLDKIGVGFVLKEEKTQSILRVVVDDAFWVRSFRNFYFKES
jgi:hypothetical protein